MDHIHARVGGTQSPQLPHGPPGHAAAAAERAAASNAHEAFWRAVWAHKATRGAAEVTVTPEYGPFPYQTAAAGGDAELWAQTVAAGERVRACFDEWQRGVSTVRAA